MGRRQNSKNVSGGALHFLARRLNENHVNLIGNNDVDGKSERCKVRIEWHFSNL